MRRPQGYVTIANPDGRMTERDSIICGHCQQIVMVKPGTAATTYLIPQVAGPATEEPGAMCRVCMRSVCLRCHAHGRCIPFERRIERMESRARLQAQVGV